LLDERRFAVTLVLLILGIQSTFYHPGQWNQNARLGAAVAFVEPGTPYTGTFRIDGLKDGKRFFTDDWAFSRGAFYSNKAPGVSFLAVVPYFVLFHLERWAGGDPAAPGLTQINAFVLNLWISVFWNIVAALALLRRLPGLGIHSREGAFVVALIYSLATLVFPYGCSAWGHSTSAAFITLGTLDVAEGSRARCLLGGLWLGMAALTEYLAALSLAAAMIYVLAGSDRWERAWKLLTGSAAPIAALLLYQELAFGSYFTTAASLSIPYVHPEKVGGFFGAPSIGNLLGMLFGRGRGFFWQMPLLLLAVFGAASWYRSGRRAYLALMIANITLYALSIAGLDFYQGGLTTSMRYMIIALPFFCVLLPDFRAFAYRKTFLLLFAVTAANMFVLAATSTMYGSESPLSEAAYPDFWKGAVAFNPILARLGVAGALPAFTVAAAYVLALGWVLRTVLMSRRVPEIP
jgi:hypothetical protein